MADDEQTKKSPENTPSKSKVKPRNRKRPPHGGKFSIKNAHTSERQIIRKRRIAAALDLRLQGHSLDEIARHLKTSRTSVHNWISGALEQMIVEPARHLLKMELRRLDEMMTGVYPDAVQGHLPSVYAYLSILDRRAKLLGLFSEPGGQTALAVSVGGDQQQRSPLEIVFVTPTKKPNPFDGEPPDVTPAPYEGAKPDHSKPALPKPSQEPFRWPPPEPGPRSWMK
jgi:hypothetical protein